MPDMTLTSVDLPAPLSPTRPTTSVGLTSKSTLSSAWTAPNRLLTPRSSSSGAVAVAVSLMPGIPPYDPEMPASWQALLNRPAHSCAGFQKPSFTTVSLTLDLTTATGLRITDGTSSLPLSVFSWTSPDGGCLPCTSATASWAAPSASGLIAL